MSETFALVLSVMERTADAWENQSEQLRGGHKRLTDAQSAVGDLGDRAAPVARTYLATWLAEVQHHADAAQGHADGLAEFTRSVVQLDEEAAAAIRAVLPWDAQDAVRPAPDGRPDFPTDDPGPSPEPFPGTP